MKKTIRLISSLVLALVLVCGAAAVSFAADATSHVTYKGKAEQFISSRAASIRRLTFSRTSRV